MEPKYRIGVTETFFIAYAKLPQAIQGKVRKFFTKFARDPFAPGINLEKLKYGKDSKLFSVRIDDTYRGIVTRQTDELFPILWVDHHDDAYAWASTRQFECHPLTREPQTFEVLPEIRQESAPQQSFLFGNLKDEELRQLGLPKAMLPFVRSIADELEFYHHQDSFPTSVFEALIWVLEGLSVKEILSAMSYGTEEEERLPSPEAFAPSKSFVIVQGEDELDRVLSGSLESWRIFLHPHQQSIVSRHFNGPARVLGGAGTGKTVVAMHRAKYLASQLKGEGRILFTTFTVNLTADIEHNLRKICTLPEMNRIDANNLDDWAVRFMEKQKCGTRVLYGNELDQVWSRVLSRVDEDPGYSIEFYQDEWSHVILPERLYTLGDYLRSPRTGCSRSINQAERIRIWRVFSEYKKQMEKNGHRDIGWLMQECESLIRKEYPSGLYRHIIVDEAQDMSPSALSLLRAMAGEERENDLFIVGDAHQRIYKNKAILSKCGIRIDGRSHLLTVNYRTTEEIRRYAYMFLQGLTFDNLDLGTISGDHCISLTRGDYPQVLHFDDKDCEINFVADKIRELERQGVPLEDICIVARKNQFVDAYASKLNELDIKNYRIRRSRTDDRGLPGVRLATMHRVKGLEFPYLFLVAINKGDMPPSSVIEGEDDLLREEAINREKCLFYVALTRAQKAAFITSFGEKSEFLLK